MSSANPQFRVLTATRAGSEINEDRVFVLPHAVIVLDGASSDVAGQGSGGWYAQHLGQTLAAALTTAPDAKLIPTLADAIRHVAQRLELRPGIGPSSTVAIARWQGALVDLLVLGDSAAALVPAHGPADVLSDSRISDVAHGLRSLYRRRLADGCGFDETHSELLAEIRAEEQRHRNRDDGYWIAEADPEAADHAQVLQCWTTDVHGVGLATDGVMRGMTTFDAIPAWPPLLRQPDPDPAGMLDAIHDAEATDPAGQRWPRSKPHDDKTLALILRADRD